jgi:hypothetical protein
MFLCWRVAVAMIVDWRLAHHAREYGALPSAAASIISRPDPLREMKLQRVFNIYIS